MGCGEWCVYYNSRGKNSACIGCRYYINERHSKFELGKVDLFELAKGLREREQRKRDESKDKKNNVEEDIEETGKIVLDICPHCGERSWWLNPSTNKHECMNKKSCPTHSMSTFLTDYFSQRHFKDNKSASSDESKLDAPMMLLSVKMFLAEVIYIINRKYEEGHVCADFAKEVCNAATERGIKCGYVVISFKNTNIAHAIVAFKTDYGLKFFEPQNANEEDVKVGRVYSARLDGVPQDNIVTKIEITWNDGGITTIE